MKAKEKAVGYIRVSTEKQQEKYSPEVQRRENEECAKANNLQIVKFFEEAKSGYKLRARTEFYRMLEYISEKKIENLVALLPNRLTRNMDDYIELTKASDNLTLHFARGKSVPISDPDAFLEIYHLETDFADAKRSSAELSVIVRDANIEKRERGQYTSRAPLGYWHNPYTKKIELDYRNNKANLVKQAFELYSTGDYSLNSLVKKMRNLGLTTREENPVPRASMGIMLKNPFYYGEFFIKSKKYPEGKLYSNKGTYPPLISKALWEKVQEVLDGNRTKKNNSRDFLFKGLIKCGYCKCDLIGEVKKEKYVYYHCTSGKMQSDSNYYKKKFGTKKCPIHDAAYLRKEYGELRKELREYESSRYEVDDKGTRKPVVDGRWFREEEIKKYFERAIDILEIDEQRKDELIKVLTEQNEERKATDEIEIKNLQIEEQQIEEKMSKLLEEKLKGNFPEDFILKEFNKLRTRNDEIDAQLENLKEHNEEKIKKGLRSLELLRKDFKTQYLKAFFAADSETRRELANFMFRTIWAGENVLPTAGFEPLYFEWNELFENFFEIGLLKKAEEWTEKNKKKSMSYARTDSNCRPTDS